MGYLSEQASRLVAKVRTALCAKRSKPPAGKVGVDSLLQQLAPLIHAKTVAEGQARLQMRNMCDDIERLLTGVRLLDPNFDRVVVELRGDAFDTVVEVEIGCDEDFGDCLVISWLTPNGRLVLHNAGGYDDDYPKQRKVLLEHGLYDRVVAALLQQYRAA